MVFFNVGINDDTQRQQHRSGIQTISEMIRKYTGYAPAPGDYAISPSGKPCLKNASDIDFSIIHCKQYTVCVLSCNCTDIPEGTEKVADGETLDKFGDYYLNIPEKKELTTVGVYMKQIENKNLKRLKCVANRFFSKEDMDTLESDFTYRKFYEIWTKKESYGVMRSIEISEDTSFPSYSKANYVSLNLTDDTAEYCLSICYE